MVRQKAESRVFVLSYPDPLARPVKMRIVLAQLTAACDGAARAQNSICNRYKQIVDLPRNFTVSWEVLKRHIEPADDVKDDSEARKGLDQKLRAIRR